ncbi:MAG TPA: S41 family peptidase [Bacteroidales bacterium]|jgi:C-terminal processing protease CtpA/Prc|nr:S41 family peptidase [Bacteroidales bacterium]
MKNLTFLFLTILLVFAYSCKKDNNNPAPPPAQKTTAEMGRDTLYEVMQELYLWYKEMPQVKKDDYSDPYKLLEAMRYKPTDRWSFVADYKEYHAEFQGNFVGHGFRLGLDNGGKVRIAMIYNNSPLYAQGVRRGWIVKTINNYNMAQIFASNDGAAYNTAIGPSTAGVTNNFVFTKPDGQDVTISSTKAAFNTNSVLTYDTLHLKTGVTGHLVLEGFIDPTQQELETAFTFFKANNIKDLILDLRYNPGGYVNTAQNLASYIGGNKLAGKPMATVQHNDKLTQYNSTMPFKTTNFSLELPRLVVITSRGTASASEFVINGLRPHINVVMVGDTTYGKPVGFYAIDALQTYTFAPMAFKIVNSLGQGDYYYGMPPNKLVIDDITHDFSDRQEADLKEAIHYLETGAFTARKSSEAMIKNGPQFSEKPEWMKNMVIDGLPPRSK